MSRHGRTPSRLSRCFPRVSGDEPVVTEIGPVVILFSPRERG